MLRDAPTLGHRVGGSPEAGGGPEMKAAQISHSNPQYSGAIFRKDESAPAFLQGKGGQEPGQRERPTPLLPLALAGSPGPSPWGWGGF